MAFVVFHALGLHPVWTLQPVDGSLQNTALGRIGIDRRFGNVVGTYHRRVSGRCRQVGADIAPSVLGERDIDAPIRNDAGAAPRSAGLGRPTTGRRAARARGDASIAARTRNSATAAASWAAAPGLAATAGHSPTRAGPTTGDATAVHPASVFCNMAIRRGSYAA